MYVDPSRVQMAIRFARIAAGSAVEREAATDDLRVFLDALWADATAEGRSRYTTAAARVPGGLPWAAVLLPDGPGMAVGGMPALAGPAVVELIVGQADPDDEGVAGYRLASGDPRAEAIVDALFRWDTPQIERTAASAGWRLEAVEELGEMRAVRGAEDVEPGVVDEGVELPGEGGAAIEAPTIPGDWSSWKRVALVSAGVLGALRPSAGLQGAGASEAEAEAEMADNIEITEEDLARNFGPGQTGDADVQAEVQANVPATVDAGSSKKAWWIAGGVVVGVAALAGGIAYMRRRSAAAPQGGAGGSAGGGGGGVVIPGGVPQGSPEPGVDLPSGTPTPQPSGGWTNVLPLPTAADVPGFDLSANWGKTPTDMRPLFALMERVSGIAGSGRIFAAIAKRESGFQPGAHNDSKEERDASRRAYANAKDRNPALKYGAQAAEFGSGGLFAGLAPYFLWTGVPEVGGRAPLLGSPPEIMFLPRVSAWFGCVYLQRLVTYYRLDDHIDIKVGWASPSLLKTGRGGSTYKAVRTRFTSDLAELGIDIDDTSTIPAKLDASRWPGALRAFEMLVGALPTRSGG